MNIRGEYWIIDGDVDFADGDIGDQNHAGVAISHIINQFADKVQSLAEDLGIDDADTQHYGEADSEKVQQVLGQIEEILSSRKQPADAYIMQHLQCNAEALAILRDNGDATSYAMEHLGWIAVRSNNVELFGYDHVRQQEVAEAIKNILYEEGERDEDSYDHTEVEVSLYDHKTGKSWSATLQDLEQATVIPRPQQAATSTYNKSIYQSKDSEENKYANSQKSTPRPINVQAQKAGLIGPGQQVWRGSSESVLSFREWLIRQL